MTRRSFTPDQRDQFKALRQLLDPKVYADKKAFGREMAILKRLRREYSPISFWVGLRPAIPLDTLLYFYTKDGREALDNEWFQYTFSLAQKKAQADLDLEREIERLENSLAETETHNQLDTAAKTPRVESKPRSTIEWIDS